MYIYIPLNWRDTSWLSHTKVQDFDLKRELIQRFQDCDVAAIWIRVLLISDP